MKQNSTLIWIVEMRRTERNHILQTNQKPRSLGPSMIYLASVIKRRNSAYLEVLFSLFRVVFFPNMCLCLSVKMQARFQLAHGLLWEAQGFQNSTQLPSCTNNSSEQTPLEKSMCWVSEWGTMKENRGFCALVTNNLGDNTHTLH